MISRSESTVTDRHMEDGHQWSKKFTWFAEEVCLGRNLFPVISHRLPFSHWEMIQIFPVKQSLCNLDHHQAKSRKQLQTERCDGQIKGNVTYNVRTIRCHCFLALAEVFNIKHSLCGICGRRQILPDDVVWPEDSYQVTYDSWYSTDDLFWYTAIMEKNVRYAKNNFQLIPHMPTALIFFMSPWSVRNANLHLPIRNKIRNVWVWVSQGQFIVLKDTKHPVSVVTVILCSVVLSVVLGICLFKTEEHNGKKVSNVQYLYCNS